MWAAEGRTSRRELGADGRTAVERDVLRLEVAAEALGAELAADARALVAAERAAEVHAHAVDAERAGPNPAGDVEAGGAVLRPHRPGQAVDGVVGDAHGVVDVVERDHHDD